MYPPPATPGDTNASASSLRPLRQHPRSSQALAGLRVLAVTASLLVASLPFAGSAHAQAAAAAATGVTGGAGAKKGEVKPSEAFPLTGSISLSASASAGTFVAGESNRPGLDLVGSWRVAYRLAAGLNLSAMQLFSKTLVTNADSGAVRPYDTTFGDVLVTLGWTPMLAGSDGTPAPLALPGGVRLSTQLQALVPTSRASRFQGRITQITPGISLAKANLFDRLTLSYGLALVKNFHLHPFASVPASDEILYARPGGNELVDGGTRVLTRTANLSFSIRNNASASVQISERFSASLTYLLFNGFRYYDAPKDELSSPYAKAGRGRVDTQWGIVGVNYNLDKAGQTALSLSATTASPPFSADNKTFRFPFFDFRSTADNYSSVSLELSHSF